MNSAFTKIPWRWPNLHLPMSDKMLFGWVFPSIFPRTSNCVFPNNFFSPIFPPFFFTDFSTYFFTDSKLYFFPNVFFEVYPARVSSKLWRIYKITRSLARASLTSSFTPFGRSGHVTHAPLQRVTLRMDASYTDASHTDAPHADAMWGLQQTCSSHRTLNTIMSKDGRDSDY